VNLFLKISIKIKKILCIYRKKLEELGSLASLRPIFFISHWFYLLRASLAKFCPHLNPFFFIFHWFNQIECNRRDSLFKNPPETASLLGIFQIANRFTFQNPPERASLSAPFLA